MALPVLLWKCNNCGKKILFIGAGFFCTFILFHFMDIKPNQSQLLSFRQSTEKHFRALSEILAREELQLKT